MYADLLPIGSVVLLKGANKRLMIVGRVVAHGEEPVISDYVGCYFPQGVVDSDELFFFEQDAIERVFFLGCQDQEELEFKEQVLSQLDEGTLVIQDGQITIIR